MYQKVILFVFLICFPAISIAQKQVPLNPENSSHMVWLDKSQPFICYISPENDYKPIFGEVDTKKNIIKFLDKKAAAKKQLTYDKKMLKLKSFTGSPEEVSKKKKEMKLIKSAIKLLGKGDKLCKKALPNTPTPTPTPAPSITPETEPTPNKDPFSGDAFSLSRYHNEKLSLGECKHLLRKAAFGGTAALLDICVNQGLEAAVNAIIETKAPEELQSEPEVFNYSIPNDNYYPVDQNGNKIAISIVGQGPSNKLVEEHWLPLLIKGNPLKEWITYQLTDWFSVNLEASTCSNTSGDLHKNCLYPYFALYHNNALNFESTEPLAGTFETLVHQQVHNVAMQFWLNNTNNCNKNGFPANQNFGRELLELFTLGTHDLHGVPTYDNRSVIAASEAASGYTTAWNGVNTTFNYYSCRPFTNDKTLFPDSAWGEAAKFTISNQDKSQHYSELVRGILYKHPYSSVYIAGGIFSRLVHQSLGANADSDKLLAQASDLMMTKNKYHIGKYIKELLMSEAMFSSASLRSAIATPTDTFVRLIRLLEIPIIKRGMSVRMQWAQCVVNDTDPDCSNPLYIQNNIKYKTVKRSDGTPATDTQYAGSIPDVPVKMRYALADSGDTPGHPPSVFGREAGTAGKWRGDQVHKGHDALTAQLLLNRINGLSRVLQAADPSKAVSTRDQKFAYNPNQEAPFKYSEKLSTNSKTNDEIVRYLEDKLDVPLTDEERSVMTEYLGSDFQTLSISAKETRLIGLIMLFYQHPLFLLS